MELLDQKSLPELFETITETVIKGLTAAELMEEGGLLEAIPFGKVAKYLAKKIFTIEDPAKALKKAISVAGYQTFVEALNTYRINPGDNENFLKEELPVIKRKLKEKTCDTAAFDLQNFSNNDTVKFYIEHLMLIVKGHVTDREYNLISRFLNDNFKLSFLESLDENELIYQKLNELLKSRHYEESVKLYKYQRYRQELKNQFDEIVLGDQNGLRLSNIYIYRTGVCNS